ncbi:hypothetical protein FKM82_024033 [Ascaphus truei]
MRGYMGSLHCGSMIHSAAQCEMVTPPPTCSCGDVPLWSVSLVVGTTPPALVAGFRVFCYCQFTWVEQCPVASWWVSE